MRVDITLDDVHLAAGMLASAGKPISRAEVQSQLTKNLGKTADDAWLREALEELVHEDPPRLTRGGYWDFGDGEATDLTYVFAPKPDE